MLTQSERHAGPAAQMSQLRGTVAGVFTQSFKAVMVAYNPIQWFNLTVAWRVFLNTLSVG